MGLFPINDCVNAQSPVDEKISIADPIDLDIFVFGLAVSSDERYVVAWGNTPQSIKNDRNLLNANGGARDVRVVDLQERSVIARGTFPSSPVSVVVDGSSIFVALSGLVNRFDLVNARPKLSKVEIRDALKDLYVFDLETMQPRAAVRMPLVPNQLFGHPEQRIGVRGTSNGRTSFSILETKSDSPRLVDNSFINLHDVSFARRNATQIEYGGAVYDLTKNRVISLSAEPRYESIVETGEEVKVARAIYSEKVRGNYTARSNDWRFPYRFGFQLVSGDVYDLERNQRFSIRARVPTSHRPPVLEEFSKTQPVCYSVSLKNDFESKRELCYLSTFRLLDGQQVGEPVLLFAQSQQRARSPNAKTAAAMSTTKIVIANRSQIFDYRLPDLNLARAEKPLTLLWPDKPWMLADQVERFVVPHDGGRGKVEFILKTNIEGVQIDTTTGEVTVDTPRLWQQFAERSARNDRPDIEIIKTIEADGIPREIWGENTPPSRIFKSLYQFSYELNQVPAYLKLEVFASDGFGQTADLAFYITVLGRIETIQQAKKQPTPVEEPKVDLGPVTGGFGPERIKRLKTLSDLENRVLSLEHKAKLISQRIETLAPQK